MNFLFWNLGKRPLLHRLARMAAHRDVDVVVLVECDAPPAEVLDALNGGIAGRFVYPESDSRKIYVFTRLPESQLVDQSNRFSGALTVRVMRPGTPSELLLVLAHFPSQINWHPNDQLSFCPEFAHAIRLAEAQRQHGRTVLLGDLNMNPFDPGVVAAAGLHGMMTRDLARRRNQREVIEEAFPTFYNPMWAFLHDRHPKPSGTFYLNASKPINYYWNTYDQVLVRPDLIDALTTVEVLDSDGRDPLVTANGWPDATNGSDHLPIFFTLTI